MFSSQFSLIFDGKTLGIHSCIRHKIFHLIRLTATHINFLLVSTRRNEQNGKQKNHFEFHYQYKYWHWSECDIICFCIQHNRFLPNQQPEKKIPSLAFAQYEYASFLKPANISLDTSPGCSNHNNNHTHQIRDDNFYSHYIAGYARDAVTKLQYTAHWWCSVWLSGWVQRLENGKKMRDMWTFNITWIRTHCFNRVIQSHTHTPTATATNTHTHTYRKRHSVERKICAHCRCLTTCPKWVCVFRFSRILWWKLQTFNGTLYFG